MKKCMRWGLFLLFLLTLCISAFADHADELIELVARNDADITYMPGIVVDLNNGSYSLQEQTCTLSVKPFLAGGSLLVPAVSLAEAVGCHATVSENGITVSSFDGSVSGTYPYAVSPAGLIDGSLKPSDKLAYVKKRSNIYHIKSL